MTAPPHVVPWDGEAVWTADTVATATARWFADGGTQIPDGALCGWTDTAGRRSAPYPEITGYGLTFLSWLGESDTEVARRAADWLVERTEAGALASRPEREDGRVYTFDLAMAAHGLLRHGADTGRPEATAAGLRLADLVIATADDTGRVPCLLPGTADAPAGAPVWSTHGSAHLLKTVQAMISADAAGHPRARATADATVAAAVAALGGTPPLPTCPGSDLVSLHALCYAAEGLWIWSSHTGEDQAAAASLEITEWVWRNQLPDGGFPGFVRPDGTAEPPGRQSDVLAQCLRLAALHGITGPDPERAAECLVASTDRFGTEAAVLYWPDSAERHRNAWASMFAVQALRSREPSAPPLRWWELV